MTRPKDTDTYNWYATPPDHIEPLPILYGEGTGNIVSTGRVASLSIGEDTLPVTDWTVSFDPAGNFDTTGFTCATGGIVSSTYTPPLIERGKVVVPYAYTTTATEVQLLNTDFPEVIRSTVQRLSDQINDDMLASIMGFESTAATEAVTEAVNAAKKSLNELQLIADIEFAKHKPRLLMVL